MYFWGFGLWVNERRYVFWHCIVVIPVNVDPAAAEGTETLKKGQQ